MAEEPKKQFDPDATVAQPAPEVDPDATVALPVAAVDPDATISGPIFQSEPDPEATFTGPAAKKPSEPDAADQRPAFDPDATDRQPAFSMDSISRMPGAGRVRKNPFAPKSTPETIQANLSALGGLNQLIALANPILGAVPQIRRTLRHPDPDGLRANLRDQIDSLATSANFAEISDATVQSATYALCALLDESAAATPWGGSWAENGLLKEVCSESGAGEGFFTRLDGLSSARDAENTDLVEFYYVCLALGFEGRYRKAEGGRQALNEIRNRTYAQISRRRPRPDGLSEHWRSATAEAAAAPALQMAAEVSARISAQHAAAAAAAAETTLPPVQPSFLSRIPRRAVWSGVAGLVGAALVFYMAALRLLDEEWKDALSSPKLRTAAERTAPGTAAAPTPAPVPAASAALAKALEGEPVTITESAGGIALTPRHERQFAPGGTQPSAELRALIQKIAAALDKTPGAIVVTGHADASPTKRYASNLDLSADRARSVVRIMSPKLGDPKRLSAAGRGEAEPAAPNDTEANRAKNRRVAIILKPAP